MEDEETRAKLQRKFPEWHIFRNGALAYAWWLNSSPPIRLRDSSFGGLEERIPVAVEAWHRTHSYMAVMEAAGELET